MSITIGKSKLTLEEFYNVTNNKYKVEISEEAIIRIKKSRDVVEKLLKEKVKAYGITTGFGSLKDKNINEEDLEKLQLNLIKSHAIGIGEPAPMHIVRGMLLLRLVCISNGNSGVRLCIAEKLVEALNKNYIPEVPIQGTVGASGDLAPLSHMILGLLGLGLAFDEETNKYIEASKVMDKLKIEAITLKAKEGLALNNGTQYITSCSAYACYNALKIMKMANLISCVSIEALHGVHHAFDKRIHEVKNHNGQVKIAEELWEILEPKSESCIKYTKDKVQDAYSLRCIPQVHGSAYDLIQFCKNHIEIEMNSSNDNPLIFDNDIISGGNFHGMYIGVASDMLALAMSILCNISERRLERMVNSSLNGFMPSFLTKNPGLNSGFMIVQYASAGITSENRSLANVNCVNNISTCEGSEDIVSMAGYSSRKAIMSVENTWKVLAMELMTSIQALEFTEEKMCEQVEKIKNYVRKELKVPKMEDDTYMKEHQDKIYNYIKSDKNDFE